MHKITHTCTCYVTNQNQTWVTLLSCIYEQNFIKICAAVWEKSKMCLTKSVNWNRKYRSQRPSLNKLEIRSPGDSSNQIWMISGQWFYRRRFLRTGQKLHKITHNSMKNKGSTPILTNIHTKHPHKIWSKSVQQFERRIRKKNKKSSTKTTTTTTTTTDTGWSLKSHSLIEYD